MKFEILIEISINSPKIKKAIIARITAFEKKYRLNLICKYANAGFGKSVLDGEALFP